MKLILLAIFLSFSMYAQTQYTTPRIEGYVAPGLFSEQLSDDALIPPKHTNDSRIGDVVSYGVQFAAPLKNQRFTIKAGLGFSQRHYSITKYTLGDALL